MTWTPPPSDLYVDVERGWIFWKANVVGFGVIRYDVGGTYRSRNKDKAVEKAVKGHKKQRELDYNSAIVITDRS
jgi:hypothetical protein